MKTHRIAVLILALILALSLSAASAEGVNAIGFQSSGAYTEYTDLGGYGSDFTAIDHQKLVLNEDGTYELTINHFNYAGAWSVIITEQDIVVYGTYTVNFSDEFGVEVELSPAARVTRRSVASSSVAYQDTDDPASFEGAFDSEGNPVAAEDAMAALLAEYGETRTAEIDFETWALTIAE